VRCKYDRGGYRVWDPKRRVVAESRDIVFFEDGLPSPTLNDLPTPARRRGRVSNTACTRPQYQADDAARHRQCAHIVPAVRSNAHDLAGGHAPASIGANTTSAHHRTPTRARGEQVSCIYRASLDKPADIDEDEEDEDANNGSDEDADSPARLIHDVSYVLSYPSKSTRSVLIRNGRGGGNSAMLDEAMHLPIAFSAGLPGGIQLSQLPDPCSTRDATTSPDTDGWMGAMDQEMANLKSHDVYELVPRMDGMRTLKLGWVFHGKFKNGIFKKNMGRFVP